MRDQIKRKTVFNWLRNLQLDIVFLQETHCHLKKEEYRWGKEWDGQTIWSRGTNRSRGVTVLFNRSVKYDVRNTVTDPNGRYIIFDLYIEDMKYKFINVYAPNSEYERVVFLNKLNDWIDPDTETLVAGDYNCTLNSDLDRINCIGNNDIGQVDIKHIMNNFDLEDVYRRRYPERKTFSWRCGDKGSRIDYWLISASLDNQTDRVEYSPCVFSDHSIVKLDLRVNTASHGNGTWKMNCNVIETDLFKNVFTSWWLEWKKKKEGYDDLNMWWDLGKKRVKELAMWCANKINYDRKFKVSNLEQTLERLEQNCESDKNEICDVRDRLKKLYEEKSKGCKVRSRVQWFEQGEKSTKFFHNLEKKNSKDKSWECIIDSNGNVVHGTENVMKRQVDFYKELYTSEEVSTEKGDLFLNGIDKSLCKESHDNLDKDISSKEALKALRLMARNKSPGPDGILTEFYQIYWKIIGDDLLEVFKYSYVKESLPFSQYLAVIILLYKKGIRENIENWRPISLLNTDVKILSKILSQRLKVVLPEIIHTDQTGCIQGRCIGQNIRLVKDIINNHDDNEVLLLLDQQKAFDRVEWKWLFRVLSKFNIGPVFQKWIHIMYSNMKSCISTNGYLSNYFPIKRGIRQGDSLSALLYIIQAEPLAEFIRKNEDLKGIDMTCGNTMFEARCCQYVDDTVVFLNNTNQICKCIKIIEDYGSASGARLNKEKTVGLIMNEQNVLRYNGDIRLTMGPEKVLGIPVGKCTDNDVFWKSVIDKIKKHFSVWKSRNLSYAGRIHIIKSIGVSNLMYACDMMTIDRQYVLEIQNVFWDFLWKGKRITVKKEICMLPRHLGGLNMVNIDVMIMVRRIKWLVRVLKSEPDKWSHKALEYFQCLDKKFDINFFALRANDIDGIMENVCIPQFYKECIMSFQLLCKKGEIVDKRNDEILWCNRNFRFNGKPICLPHWSCSGIKYVSDLIKNSVIDEQDVYQKLKHKAGFVFEMSMIRKSIPTQWRNISCEQSGASKVEKIILEKQFKIPGENCKSLTDLESKDIYDILAFSEIPIIKSKEYWTKKLSNNIDFDKWFICNFQNMLTPRSVLDFNWRLFHGQITTENKLKNMNLSDGKCCLCHKEGENVEHILYDCTDTIQCWNHVKNIIDRFTGDDLRLDKTVVLSGYLMMGNIFNVINMVLSITRWIIWKRRCIMKYENEHISITELVKWIHKEISDHVQILNICMKKKKKNGMVDILSNIEKVMDEIQ